MGGRGRGGKSRTQRKHFKDGRDNVWKKPKSDPSSTPSNNTLNTNSNINWQPFSTENTAFDEYYKEQGIVGSEEWDKFVEALRSPLPAAFRINSSTQFCEDIKSQLENDFRKSVQNEVTDGGELDAIRPLPWYPNNLAWHSTFSRMQLRKNQTLERFHEFLKLENEIGNITRQEAVSMVPPLFLDVQPEHFILDMCAAPGSKTFQLLEIIYQSTKPGSLPDGMVIANDLDVQRCNLLIHQTKRMCTANLIVTNNEAQQFPGCRSNKNSPKLAETVNKPEIDQLLFDRVLCDVPCSGDGTLRKAPDLWRKWNPGMGNGLHGLQIQIAMRGLALLKVGGKMVYSTCSMNPVEDEAVVAEILRRCEGSVELLDVSGDLPQLVRRPGLRKWKVRDKSIWLSSYKDVSKYGRSGIPASAFPYGRGNVAPQTGEKGNHENGNNADAELEVQPMEDVTTSNENLDEEVSDLPLERCMRIVPHDQNSGAFFIAVLQKVSPLPAVQEKPSSKGNKSSAKERSQEVAGVVIEKEVAEIKEIELTSEDASAEKIEVPLEADLVDDNADVAALESDTNGENHSEETQPQVNGENNSAKATGKRKLQMQGRWKGVDPILFFKDEAIINSIKEFYGIKESFSFDGHLISRNNDNNHVKRIYYVSKSVKDALELNFLVGQPLKISSVGLKMFERQTSREGTSAPCSFRISSEGLPVILPHITKQILYASLVDFKHLLQYKAVKYADFVDAEFGKKASELKMGCCVLILRDGKSASDPIEVDASTIAIGCWKGRASLSVMVTAIDCQELLERLLFRMETENGSSAEETNIVDEVLDMAETKNFDETEKPATDA